MPLFHSHCVDLIMLHYGVLKFQEVVEFALLKIAFT